MLAVWCRCKSTTRSCLKASSRQATSSTPASLSRWTTSFSGRALYSGFAPVSCFVVVVVASVFVSPTTSRVQDVWKHVLSIKRLQCCGLCYTRAFCMHKCLFVVLRVLCINKCVCVHVVKVFSIHKHLYTVDSTIYKFVHGTSRFDHDHSPTSTTSLYVR